MEIPIRLYHLFFLIVYCLSCSTSDLKETTNNIDGLHEKFEFYRELSQKMVDSDGFIYANECHSLLWTSLYQVAVGGYAYVLKARDEEHRWYRRPLNMGDCYPNESKSSISKDILLGLMIYFWKLDKDYTNAYDLYSYGKEHNWIMGKGELTRTAFSPALIGTLAKIIEMKGGPNLYPADAPQYSLILLPGARGFEAHLQALHANLRAELDGRMLDTNRDILKQHRDRSPENPLFHAVVSRWDDGNQIIAIDLLLNSSHWPNDRLPSTTEHCEKWLIQREQDSDDWLPCPDGREHSAGDWLFVAGLIF